MTGTSDARHRCWIVAAAGLAACATALLILVETSWSPLHATDRWVSAGLHDAAHDHPGFTRANRVLTDWVWDPVTMRLVAVVTVLALVAAGALRLAAWIGATTLVAVAVQYAVRAAVARPRPSFPEPVDTASQHAFPSGHVTAATVTCGLLLALLLLSGRATRLMRLAAWTGAVVSVVGVGFTRVFLGVHWPTDVLAGWLFAGAVLATSTALFAPWRARHLEHHGAVDVDGPATGRAWWSSPGGPAWAASWPRTARPGGTRSGPGRSRR